MIVKNENKKIKLFVSPMGLEKKSQSRKAISVSEIQYVFGTLNMEVGCMMDFGLVCFRFLTAPGHLPCTIVFSHL